MIDYEYKARLMEEGLPDLSKQVAASQWIHYAHLEPKAYTMPLYTANAVDTIMNNDRPDDWRECKKINHAEFARSTRLYHRVESIIKDNGGIFLTLTFSDDTLATTSAKTRKAYVQRYLKSLNARYVANIDFGGKKGREHYHAVVSLPKVDYKPWHDYGAIKGEKIAVKDVTPLKLGKYISKLSNHAIKATARCCKVIYSR